MTEDTKRALKIIEPIANELNIKVSADDRLLHINEVKIGIGCNSTYATIMEFVGYLMLIYNDKFRDIGLRDEQIDKIIRYWFNDEQLKKIGVTE